MYHCSNNVMLDELLCAKVCYSIQLLHIFFVSFYTGPHKPNYLLSIILHTSHFYCVVKNNEGKFHTFCEHIKIDMVDYTLFGCLHPLKRIHINAFGDQLGRFNKRLPTL